MKYPKDLTGLKFGKLTVVSKSERTGKNNEIYLNCVCDCGDHKSVRKWHLVSGNTKSCNGPLHHLRLHKQHPSEYYAWAAMKSRCYYKKYPLFHRYGGRGIIVCDQWISSFKTFLNDVGLKPTPSHSIDRIDNDGNYCPDNCKWSTPTEQANNTGTNNVLTFNGKSQTVAQWAKELDINQYTLHSRLKGSKWSIEKALITPVQNLKDKS